MDNSFFKSAVASLAGLMGHGTGEYRKVSAAAAKIDFAVLKVAMMISALDGEIRPQEFAAFRRLAEQCRATVIDGSRLWDEALRAAGYILVQARIKSDRQLALVFVREALEALPKSFTKSSREYVRRAYATWLTMAMADGEYAGVEKSCLTSLRAKLDEAADPGDAFIKRASVLIAAGDFKALRELVVGE